LDFPDLSTWPEIGRRTYAAEALHSRQWLSGVFPGPAVSAHRKTPLDHTEALERVRQFLNTLAGPETGHELSGRLLASDESLEQLARELAASSTLERLYKEAKTGMVKHSEPKGADPTFVGIPELETNLPFEEQFERFFKPRLALRADGFSTLFRSLRQASAQPLILETGTMRIPGNWKGDGQSTFMFDTLVRTTGGLFFSIDVTLESLETARRACSSATNLLFGDSVATLHQLSALIRRPADLLYLDSYDLDPQDPMPSAIHHAMELMAVNTLIGPGTLVCVDDYCVDSQVGGKGLLLDPYFSRIRAEVLYSGYQRIWRVK
jgi:hypothetical protein